jgi:hypothetical protein
LPRKRYETVGKSDKYQGFAERYKFIPSFSAPYQSAQKLGNPWKWPENKGISVMPGFCPQGYPQKLGTAWPLPSAPVHCSQ